ncbi:MAG: type II secretion system F family protein [Thermoguttaceae bacterium]
MSRPTPPAVTLEHLIALGDEMAALARAGVPLESGLGALGRDMPGGLGRLARTLAQRTSLGQPLVEVLDQLSPRLPKVYRAVVEVGIRTGRLPAALEALAGALRRLAETRRGVTVMLVYPLLVVALAWGLFGYFTARIAPGLAAMLDAVGARGTGVFHAMAGWGRWAWVWGPVGPAVLAIFACLWWYATTRASVAGPRASIRLLGWLPWLGPMLRWSRTAVQVEVLALLVESRVPLDESLRLAGEACGDWPLPPLIKWLTAGGGQPALAAALRHASDTYRRRARQQAELARVFLPMLVTLGTGGVVTLAYGLALFWPYVKILRALEG